MHGSPRLPGVDEIRVPGEGSLRVRQEREQAGIPIPEALYGNLAELAQSLETELFPVSGPDS